MDWLAWLKYELWGWGPSRHPFLTIYGKFWPGTLDLQSSAKPIKATFYFNLYFIKATHIIMMSTLQLTNPRSWSRYLFHENNLILPLFLSLSLFYQFHPNPSAFLQLGCLLNICAWFRVVCKCISPSSQSLPRKLQAR